MRFYILEDNADRCDEMHKCLSDRFWQYPVSFFRDAPSMIAALSENLSDALLISLDHDLEMIDAGNHFVDPGSGREVAQFIADHSPSCPVVIHTSNTHAALGMEMVLRDGGWQTVRVAPYFDTRWISEAWFPAVRQAIVEGVPQRGPAPTRR
jgi:hypothetical protein